MSQKLHFVLGDKLPIIYDTAISIFTQQHEEEYNYIMMDDDGEAYLQDDSFTDFGNASSISRNRSGHARVQQTYIDTAIQLMMCK